MLKKINFTCILSIFLLLLLTTRSFVYSQTSPEINNNMQKYGYTVGWSGSYMVMNDKDGTTNFVTLESLYHDNEKKYLISGSIFFPVRKNELNYDYLIIGRFAKTSSSSDIFGIKSFKTRQSVGFDLSLHQTKNNGTKNKDYVYYGIGISWGLEISYKSVFAMITFGPHFDTSGDIYNLWKFNLGMAIADIWIY